MIRVAVTTLHARERNLFFLVLTACSIAFCAYVYFLCSAVVHVVMRQETDAAIIETAARIADLEVRYVAAKHAVTAETAMAFGFVERPERTYVSRATTNLVLNTDYPTDE